MLLQQDVEQALITLLGILIGTIVIALILYLATLVIISSRKARDKVILIIIEALITVLILPLVIGVIASVLGELGTVLAALRVDGGGDPSFLPRLAIIFGFLILLAMTKFFLDTTWGSALWISILTLFVLYILLTLVPELYDLFSIGL
ncbi:MAG: hypothetical protein EU541_02280 [Promethearchaeota archaeon]|nr:MAG: hypothetical protein EU541_02280 [Candidatus Lokiarchaeota archaeon]